MLMIVWDMRCKIRKNQLLLYTRHRCELLKLNWLRGNSENKKKEVKINKMEKVWCWNGLKKKSLNEVRRMITHVCAKTDDEEVKTKSYSKSLASNFSLSAACEKKWGERNWNRLKEDVPLCVTHTVYDIAVNVIWQFVTAIFISMTDSLTLSLSLFT